MANPKPVKPQPLGIRLKEITKNRALIIVGRWFMALVILIMGGVLYYAKVYSDPQRTFWAMIDNNLASNGVTKISTQQGLAGTTDSVTQLVFNPASRVHYIKKITDKSTTPNSRLTLEGIGTPQADYQRYSLIDRPGSGLDYSSVYNLWLKGDQPKLFSSTMFGAILFGNLRQPQRADVVSKLRDAYRIELDKAARQTNSRIRTYSVTVSLQKYAVAARAYAQAMGLPNANQILPSAYQPNARVQFAVSADVPSRQITKIQYKNPDITETYVSYGVASAVGPPASTVNNQQFQNALNAVSQ